MKCRPEEMNLFELDYGELIRPPYRILRGRGWGQCTNETDEHLVVYGPKHRDEPSIFDTSPYVLPPDMTTPDSWDCEGYLVPSDRLLRRWGKLKRGPLAVKFWNFRRFRVRKAPPNIYRSSWDNGVFEPSQINWAIPNFPYQSILGRVRRSGEESRRSGLGRPSVIPPQWRKVRGSPANSAALLSEVQAGGLRPQG